MNGAATAWPDLRFAAWREAASTLQLWTQIDDRLVAGTSQGEQRTLALEAKTVADFYTRVMDL